MLFQRPLSTVEKNDIRYRIQHPTNTIKGKDKASYYIFKDNSMFKINKRAICALHNGQWVVITHLIKTRQTERA